MALKNNGRLSRREMLRALSLCAAGGASGLSPFLSGCREQVQTPEDKERFGVRKDGLGKPPKFLIVISATGGASIIDSFLAVRESECATPSKINCHPDGAVTSVAGTSLRAVKYSATSLGAIPNIVFNTDQAPFLTKHKQDMLVATCTGTSVNHIIAQKRSVTGNGAWNGRTLQEAMALEYGADFPIPNVNMGSGGYLERGADDSLPAYCYSEAVANAALWPLGLDGVRGIKGAPDKELVQLARKMRNEKLDPESVFARTFAKSDRLNRWYSQRGASQERLEAMDLITRLNILPDAPPDIPLTEYGLAASPDAAKLRAVFPNFFTDPFEGQAAAAFLLLKYKVSCAVTIGPNFNLVIAGGQLSNPPLAFDYSHNDHRGAQALMWNRILGVVDRLSDLLKAEVFDAATGETFWDRTLVYVATDFGRTKTRQALTGQFGTGHDLNNGFFIMSPMAKGNTILGGVNPNTAQTYGFDTETGLADVNKNLSNERDIYAGILHTLSVDTTGSGLPDARAFRNFA